MRAILLAALLAFAPPALQSQEAGPATLLADTVRLEGGSVLVAEGAVEVFYDGTRLRATRITYDRGAKRLTIEGPIRLDDGDDVVIVADQGRLDADLRNGILTSARLVLDRELQLAATELARIDGRYTEMANTVASSCNICAAGGTPTWEIRARRVIHDEQESMIWFDRAQFRLFGMPVAYFPTLRLPDSTRPRATGFLIPRLRSTTQLGLGFKQPLFVTLGPSADVTFTPYLSEETRTLETRYRQALRFGEIDLTASVSDDTLRPDDLRYFLSADAAFRLPAGYRLEIDIEEVSDEAYLVDYGYDDADRLEKEVRISRARRDELVTASIAGYETLRPEEMAIEDQLPSTVADYGYEQRLRLGRGELRLGLEATSIYRPSGADGTGRDTTSANIDLRYIDRRVLASGLVLTNTVGAEIAAYEVTEDRRFAGTRDRFTPGISSELRLPLQRSGADGTSYLLEPVAQVAYAPSWGDRVPNEDSRLVEFDEGNLLAMSRFPGQDRIETGLRANLGLAFTAVADGGLTVGASGGRIFRAEPVEGFSPGSGLSGTESDWLAAGRISLGETYEFTARALFDDSLDIRKNESRLAVRGEGVTFEGAYVWLDADPRENRTLDLNEFVADTSMRLSRHVIGSLGARYDLEADRAAEAGLGLEYRTECISIAAGLTRRFTGTAGVEPSTSFSLGLELAGFGSDRFDDTYRSTCKG